LNVIILIDITDRATSLPINSLNVPNSSFNINCFDATINEKITPIYKYELAKNHVFNGLKK
jgi:hypothetical protein